MIDVEAVLNSPKYILLVGFGIGIKNVLPNKAEG